MVARLSPEVGLSWEGSGDWEGAKLVRSQDRLRGFRHYGTLGPMGRLGCGWNRWKRPEETRSHGLTGFASKVVWGLFGAKLGCDQGRNMLFEVGFV